MAVITDAIIGGIAWEAFSRSLSFYAEGANDFVLRVYITQQLRALEQLEGVSDEKIEEVTDIIKTIVIETPAEIKQIEEPKEQKEAFQEYVKNSISIKNITVKNSIIINSHNNGNIIGDHNTTIVNRNRNSSISIDSDNSGNIITGDHNTIISDSEIDYEAKLKKILYSLPIGNILFNAPKEIHYDESKSVTLRISKKNISSKDLAIENQQIEKEVKISSFMSAKLMSDDFKIRTWSNKEQLIDESTFTEWKWDISPNITNKNGKLYLRITIRIPLKSHQDEKKDLPIFEKSIDILVN